MPALPEGVKCGAASDRASSVIVEAVDLSNAEYPASKENPYATSSASFNAGHASSRGCPESPGAATNDRAPPLPARTVPSVVIKRVRPGLLMLTHLRSIDGTCEESAILVKV